MKSWYIQSQCSSYCVPGLYKHILYFTFWLLLSSSFVTAEQNTLCFKTLLLCFVYWELLLNLFPLHSVTDLWVANHFKYPQQNNDLEYRLPMCWIKSGGFSWKEMEDDIIAKEENKQNILKQNMNRIIWGGNRPVGDFYYSWRCFLSRYTINASKEPHHPLPYPHTATYKMLTAPIYLIFPLAPHKHL